MRPRTLQRALAVFASVAAGVALVVTAGDARGAAPPAPAPADRPAGDGSITLERIMAHPDWLGRAPERPYWADDGRSIYYYRSEPESDGFDPRDFELFQADLLGQELRRVEPEHYPAVDSDVGVFDRDRRNKAFARAGDIYVKELATGTLRQLTRTAAGESDPFFLSDGRVGWLRDDQVFARDLSSGLEEQLFELRAEKDPLDKRREELIEADYLRQQQERLFDWIRDEDRRSSETQSRDRDRRRRDPSRLDPPFYLGEKLEIAEVFPSPDGRRALVTTTATEPKPPAGEKMPQYVTATGRTETRDVRPRVGAPQKPEKLWLVDRTTGRAVALDLAGLPELANDPLADLRRAAEERKKERKRALGESAGEKKEESGESDKSDKSDKADDSDESGESDKGKEGKKEASPRGARFSAAWSPGGERVAIEVLSIDNKDRWLATLDPNGTSLTSLHHQRDPAWIAWDFRAYGWLRDERRVYFLSEESGWSQLYVVAAEGDDAAKPRRLTHGSYVVDSPTLSPDGRFLYYTANPTHPGNYEVFRVAVDGGEPEAVTALGGVNDYVLSPAGDQVLLRHSSVTRPPELWRQDARAGAEAVQLTRTVSPEFAALPWVAPQVVQVPSSHGVPSIYGRLYLPTAGTSGGASSPRPAVVFIHGAGYLQNAHLGWSTYFREFMFHTLLAQRGYVVLDLDYRGSAGYGRDWRTAIYRHMGGPEVEDLADGVRYLVENHGVDPARVGAYGGSYGGFLTLMAMFTEPELFAAGAALRPVTDWAHYNHPYTSNILNTPELDHEAYERSSPIEYAAGLAKPLLLCSGMLDDNVFFQDTVRLSQKLIELEKKDWEVAFYPIEPHGFREPASWLDEYRRILELFERHLRS